MLGGCGHLWAMRLLPFAAAVQKPSGIRVRLPAVAEFAVNKFWIEAWA